MILQKIAINFDYISYFNLNIFLLFRDAVITCIVNTCTCLTAGVLVFSILGYMAHLQGVTVHDVARSGPGLVFLTYPELVLTLNGSFIWAILFFAMLLVSTKVVIYMYSARNLEMAIRFSL